MKLDENGREWLTRALSALAEGRDRAFEDALWLGFGDDWRPLYDGLVKGRCVTVGGPDRETPAITDEGHKLLTRLALRTARAG
jgi:hypothetical protein